MMNLCPYAHTISLVCLGGVLVMITLGGCRLWGGGHVFELANLACAHVSRARADSPKIACSTTQAVRPAARQLSLDPRPKSTPEGVEE